MDALNLDQQLSQLLHISKNSEMEVSAYADFARVSGSGLEALTHQPVVQGRTWTSLT